MTDIDTPPGGPIRGLGRWAGLTGFLVSGGSLIVPIFIAGTGTVHHDLTLIAAGALTLGTALWGCVAYDRACDRLLTIVELRRQLRNNGEALAEIRRLNSAAQHPAGESIAIDAATVDAWTLVPHKLLRFRPVGSQVLVHLAGAGPQPTTVVGHDDQGYPYVTRLGDQP